MSLKLEEPAKSLWAVPADFRELPTSEFFRAQAESRGGKLRDEEEQRFKAADAVYERLKYSGDGN